MGDIMIKEDKIEALQSTIDLFQHLERTGVEVCKCNIGYVCGYHQLQLMIDDLERPHNNAPVKVRCTNTGVVYCSMAQASKETLIAQASISQCCKGINKSAGKYLGQPRKWEYA
jgi:hypothetical protein